jgi:hypothetical protein
MAMHNPGHLMIAIAMPNRLDRKEGNGRSNSDDGDIAVQAIQNIIDCLHEKGPAGVGLVKLFSKSLERMVEATQDGDDRALHLASNAALKALQGLMD